MGAPYAVNERAALVMGRRNVRGVVPIDEPCELGYHCPSCDYELIVNGDYDERLTWSEYESFLWCSVCNFDYPSCFCQPRLEDAVATFLDGVERAVRRRTRPE